VVRGTGIWRVHRPYTINADFPKHFRQSLDWRVWQVCVYQRNNYGGVVCFDVGIEDDSGGEEGDMKKLVLLIIIRIINAFHKKFAVVDAVGKRVAK
jgi:hypothetical protein